MSSAPETMEGWYVLHDCYRFDWKAWRRLDMEQRREMLSGLRDWLISARGSERGDSGAFIVSGQKAEIMFIHYRPTPAALNAVRRDLMACDIADLFIPSYGYLSIIEVSLYEATAMAHRMLAKQGLTSDAPTYAEAYQEELAKQTQQLEARCFRSLPDRGYVCFYPMSKRRGEHDNWYLLSQDERRQLMRGHGRLGHKFHQSVTQIISGSTGLDDWEWGVDLHSDDPLVFKKLVYEMRFDPVSARFAEFGQFFIGKSASPEELCAFIGQS
ncbi:MAG: heme-dependent peroxidase [Planctomycetota bacterium]|nr:MAG: heme-dependent peroxidase [Planctomycetota bacterium]